MLVERTTVPLEGLPVTEFRDHLRLGTGFADDGVQDIVLESYVRAALAAIEARTGKILLQREFTWTLTRWKEFACQALPTAPVDAITEVKLVDHLGQETIVESESYRLRKDAQSPSLVAVGSWLPKIPTRGSVDISFTAGFAATWPDVPPDLGQAVFLLAAHYYENRSALSGNEKPMPFGVSLLIDRYRRIRLFGGRAQ